MEISSSLNCLTSLAPDLRREQEDKHKRSTDSCGGHDGRPDAGDDRDNPLGNNKRHTREALMACSSMECVYYILAELVGYFALAKKLLIGLKSYIRGLQTVLFFRLF